MGSWALAAPVPEEDFAVLPDNWDAVRLFAAASSQWRTAGLAGAPVGLDYAGVEAVARALKLTWAEALFDKLRGLEDAALAALGERRERER